jgi:septum formation protein
VTRAKLLAARERLARRGWPQAPVLCSDTTVALGARILGKPADAEQARQTLEALSGRTHQVLTAVAVYDGRRTRVALSRSAVQVALLPPEVIAAYVASGEPFGKAGAYAVQSAFGGWIAQIKGSYSGIMGLPLHETTQLLRQARVRMALTPT